MTRGRAATALAALLVFAALVLPATEENLNPLAFLRLPVEGLLAAVLVLVLPERVRRVAVVACGVLAGVVAILKIADLGFDAVLNRPFDLVLDWYLLGPAVDYLDVTLGAAAAVGAVVAAVLLAAGLLVLTTWAALRLSRVAVRHRTTTARAVLLLAVVSILVTVPGLPLVSTSSATVAADHVRQVQAGLHDQRVFAEQAAGDPFRDVAGERLLTALRGKDVLITFVESYGRSALEHPELAPRIGPALDAGTTRLRAAGYGSRSGFLTSPVAGAGSWLAQATLLSGLWIDNQLRYHTLLASDRLTLGGAFRRARWRAVGVLPGITEAWPEGRFFDYDRIYAAGDLGYRGPRFGYATMPDQYTLATFQRTERQAPGRGPLMAAIPLVTSHSPWPAAPRPVPWDAVGDGAVFHSMPASDNQRMDSIFGSEPAAVRADYAQSLRYSLDTVVSYVETHGDDNLVVVMVGDHQPAQFVTGDNAGKDVPVSIITRDREVLDRISGWAWEDGLKPGPRAPVWPMSAFRDRFLTAFGPPAA
ncbi:sulfatase [Amycolatopsis suaedae]|uniref:Sulfatase n=1 Tax=Amycolatopsis suaedae TaxID=2510978 RepID=A0A4Q7J2S5_9PSEU|nr:sulfatase [Amycolatopsis suaedae]RZQ61227.1 sulfatase [Amycolatopsis suaedae]